MMDDDVVGDRYFQGKKVVLPVKGLLMVSRE